MKKLIGVLLIVLGITIPVLYFSHHSVPRKTTNSQVPTPTSEIIPTSGLSQTADPLSISHEKQKSYPGSELKIVQTLHPGLNSTRYIVLYQSDGLKLFGLLTVPTGPKPAGGWPVILFNHGYIPPRQYSAEESYATFVTPFASSGFIVFKPDYRGNGNSPGTPVQPYTSSDYLTDSMNALSSVKLYTDANPQKIGVFGHSMGGNISLHELVISPDVKAGVIMTGVVGDESGLLAWWDRRFAVKSIVGNDLDTYYVIKNMVSDHGTPDTNPSYWNAIDPTKFITDISAPVQIQVGTNDTVVPPSFSSSLRDLLQNAGKPVEYHEYFGADHNLTPDTSQALKTAVAFFAKYLK